MYAMSPGQRAAETRRKRRELAIKSNFSDNGLAAGVSKLSYDDLLAHFHMVRARLMAMRNLAVTEGLSKFHVGQIVEFDARGRHGIKSKVLSINSKSVSVEEVEGCKKWRVHPSFLRVVS